MSLSVFSAYAVHRFLHRRCSMRGMTRATRQWRRRGARARSRDLRRAPGRRKPTTTQSSASLVCGCMVKYCCVGQNDGPTCLFCGRAVCFRCVFRDAAVANSEFKPLILSQWCLARTACTLHRHITTPQHHHHSGASRQDKGSAGCPGSRRPPGHGRPPPWVVRAHGLPRPAL